MDPRKDPSVSGEPTALGGLYKEVVQFLLRKEVDTGLLPGIPGRRRRDVGEEGRWEEMAI